MARPMCRYCHAYRRASSLGHHDVTSAILLHVNHDVRTQMEFFGILCMPDAGPDLSLIHI